VPNYLFLKPCRAEISENVEILRREAQCRYPQRSRPSEQRRASAKINATLEGTRQKGSWPRRSLIAARCGDAPRSLLAIRPSASTRDPFQYFNSLLGRISVKTPSANNPCPEIRRNEADQWAEHREANRDVRN